MPLQTAIFAMILASAGVPLYIHLPQYLSTQVGLSLATVSAILLGIRVLDFVQDPWLGRMIDRFPKASGKVAALGLAGMAGGFLMLFTIPVQGPPVVWITVALIVIFSAYSVVQILFYSHSRAISGSGDMRSLFRLAAWRESGLLVGIILSALAPVVLLRWVGGDGFAYFGAGLAAAAVLVGMTTRRLWQQTVTPAAPLNLRALRRSGANRLLLLGLVNSLPVAVTSTLFLFFVQDRLALPDLAGLFLILFFAAAGLSVPIWSRAASRYSARTVLTLAMGLAILAFIGASLLPVGAAIGFAVICIASGAALGADMALLPALFSVLLDRAGLQTGQAFGLWSFVSKLALALAAGMTLPLLDHAGFRAGMENTAQALLTLNAAYALLPCALKLGAIALLHTLPKEVFRA